MNATDLSHTLHALADETRLRILLMLSEREACVCELMDAFGMPQSKLSHHLIILRKAGFLADEKRGKWNYYRISDGDDPVLRKLLASIPEWIGSDRTGADQRRIVRAKKKLNITCCPPRTDISKGKP